MVKRGMKIWRLQNKRGQIYLAAAIIIVAAIFGFLAATSYATKSSNSVVYDLKKELNIETGNVVDYSIYNNNDTNLLLENWTELYAGAMRGKEVDKWIFVYGNSRNLTVLEISNQSAGDVNLFVGDSQIILNVVTSVQKKTNLNPGSDNVDVDFAGFRYNFKLLDNQNFMFIIKKEGYIAEQK